MEFKEYKNEIAKYKQFVEKELELLSIIASEVSRDKQDLLRRIK